MGSKIRKSIKKNSPLETPANERIAIIEPFEDHSKNVGFQKEAISQQPLYIKILQEKRLHYGNK